MLDRLAAWLDRVEFAAARRAIRKPRSFWRVAWLQVAGTAAHHARRLATRRARLEWKDREPGPRRPPSVRARWLLDGFGVKRRELDDLVALRARTTRYRELAARLAAMDPDPDCQPSRGSGAPGPPLSAGAPAPASRARRRKCR